MPAGVPKETLGDWPSPWEQSPLPGGEPPGDRPVPPHYRRHPTPGANGTPEPNLSPPSHREWFPRALGLRFIGVYGEFGGGRMVVVVCYRLRPPAPAIPSVGTSLQTCSCSPVRPGDTVTARHSASGIHRAPVPAMAAATAAATAAAQPVRAPAPRPRPRQRPGLRAPAATCPRPRERHPASPPGTGIGTGRGTPREQHCVSPREWAPGTEPLGTTRGITPGNGNEQWITNRTPWNGRHHCLRERFPGERHRESISRMDTAQRASVSGI